MLKTPKIASLNVLHHVDKYIFLTFYLYLVFLSSSLFLNISQARQICYTFNLLLLLYHWKSKRKETGFVVFFSFLLLKHNASSIVIFRTLYNRFFLLKTYRILFITVLFCLLLFSTSLKSFFFFTGKSNYFILHMPHMRSLS